MSEELASNHIKRGFLLLNQGLLKQAREELGNALSFEPENAYALYLMSEVENRLGNSDQAIHLLEQVLGLNPQNTDALDALANIYLQKKLTDKAEEAVSNSLQIDPEGQYALSIAAVIAQNKKDYEKMHDIALRAYQLYPEDGGVAATYAAALVNLKQSEEARDVFERALELDPLAERTHNMFARFLKEQGETDAALKHIQEALRINPNSSEARFALVDLLSARIPVLTPIIDILEKGLSYQVAQFSIEGANPFLEAIPLLVIAPVFLIAQNLSILLLRLSSQTGRHVPDSLKRSNNIVLGIATSIVLIIFGGCFLWWDRERAREAERKANIVTEANSEIAFLRLQKAFVDGKKLEGSRDDFEALYAIEKKRTPQNLYRLCQTALWLGIFEGGQLNYNNSVGYFLEAREISDKIAARENTLEARQERIFTDRFVIAYCDYLLGRDKTVPDHPFWFKGKGALK